MKAIIEIDCFSSYLCGPNRLKFMDFLLENFSIILEKMKISNDAEKDIFDYLFRAQEFGSKHWTDYSCFKNQAMKLYDGLPNLQRTSCDIDLHKGLVLDRRVQDLTILKAKFLRIIKDDDDEIKISNDDRDD